MARYHNKLNEYQINKLNLVENIEMRKSLMSVLSYMMIVNDRKNTDYQEHQLSFLEKDFNKLTISFEKLHKLYKIKHKKVSLQTLKNRIERLIELKLLVVVDKIKKTNMYAFVLNKPCDISQISSDNVSDFSTSEPLDLLEKIKSKVSEEKIDGTTKDKDCIQTSEFDYDGYIDSEKKVCDLNIVNAKAAALLKALNVRSTWIQDRVKSKLEKYYHNITIKHLELYITKVISNVQAEYHRYWKTKNIEESQTYKKNARVPAFVANCEGRNYSDSEYESMENRLLGWE